MRYLIPQSWPAFIVGVILLTYWVRVLMLVRKTKREAGHHANFIPEEKTGRINRMIWIPAVVLWIFLPLLASFGLLPAVPGLIPLVGIPVWLQWLAAGIAVVAFAITWICWRNMGKNWRMGIDPKEKTQLVLNGPFAYVRHPIYGLSQVLVIMTVLVYPSAIMIVVAMLHVLFMQWEVRREDRYLVATHGEPYARYQANVARFIPRLTPYRP
jgi:protein-S-isoprenylcysteine O-methyltransferase Ste14